MLLRDGWINCSTPCLPRNSELVKGGHVPDAAIAGFVRDYHGINPQQHHDLIVEYFIRSLNNALSKRRQDVTEAIYDLLEGSPALSRAFYARVLTNPDCRH